MSAALQTKLQTYLDHNLNVLLIGRHGTGKALSLDTEVPTPCGWTTIEKLQIGDEIFDETGNICNVIAKSAIYKNHDCYMIYFSDGSKVLSDSGHLWSVYIKHDRDAESKNNNSKHSINKIKRIRTTAEMHKTLHVKNGKSSYLAYSIKTTNPIITLEKKLLIDPYVLGCWLGDGTSSNSQITCFDNQIIEEISKKETVSSTNVRGRFLITKLQTKLKEINVYKNKHIPKIYLRSSIEQRLNLLQGLMDTDGYVDKAGHCEFTTIRKHLADEFYELAISLGSKATINTGIATLYGKNCGLKYRVNFTLDLPAFKLKRKLERQLKGNEKIQGVRRNHRFISKIEKVKTVDTQCICVNSVNKLFLVSRSMIPTHNSSIIQELSLKNNLKMKYFSAPTMDPYVDLIGVPAPDKENDVLKFFKQSYIKECDILFFDEINRAKPKVLDAIFELIQFKSINGEKFPNLRCVWGAMNPPGEDYSVEELDPAFIDRFHCYVKMRSNVDLDYLKTKVSEPVASAMHEWWNTCLDDAQRASFSPRRVEYVAQMIEKNLFWKESIPIGGYYPVDALNKLIQVKRGLSKQVPLVTKENVINNVDLFAEEVKSDLKLAKSVASLGPEMSTREFIQCIPVFDQIQKDILAYDCIAKMFSTKKRDLLSYIKSTKLQTNFTDLLEMSEQIERAYNASLYIDSNSMHNTEVNSKHFYETTLPTSPFPNPKALIAAGRRSVLAADYSLEEIYKKFLKEDINPEEEFTIKLPEEKENK